MKKYLRDVAITGGNAIGSINISNIENMLSTSGQRVCKMQNMQFKFSNVFLRA